MPWLFMATPGTPKISTIWIDQDTANVQLLLACLREFGFASLELSAEDFTCGDNVIQLGYPPRRVNLISGIKGLDFSTAYERRATVNVDDINVDYVDLVDLIESKRIAGRLQDLVDIEKLQN
jgi:hypothetical protein